MAFDAFMSYSHAADGQLAPALQRGLYQFNKPWYRKRALRIFRDKTSLSASPALWPSIERALSESTYFLLLASPTAAKSVWVTAEVNWWLSNRAIDKLLIVLTDGELSWDSTKRDFDWDHTDAIPRNLEARLSSEPLYVDLRWAKTVNDLSLRHGQFRGAVLDLSAPLHGIPKDELDGEDVRQYRRMRQVRFVAISALIAFAAVAVWQAVVARLQANRAVAQRLAAQADLSRRDEAYSCLDRAALLAVESLSMTPLLETNRFVQEMLQVLPITSIRSGGGGQRSLISPTGRHAAIQGHDGLTRIHDLESGEELRALEHKAKAGMLQFDPTGTTFTSLIEVDGSTSLRTVNLSTREVSEHRGIAGSVIAVAARPDQTYLAVAVSSGLVKVIEAHTGHILATGTEMYGDTHARFSPSGKYVGIAVGDMLKQVGVVQVIDTMTGESRTLRFDLPIAALAFRADDEYLALTEQGGWGFARGPNAYLVEIKTGKVQSTIPVPLDTGLISFSPDGRLLALAGQLGIEIVQIPSGTRVSSPAVSGVSAATFTPDSAYIVVGTTSTSLPKIAQSVGDEEELELREDYCDLGRLRIFESVSGIERFMLDRKASSSQIVFSPDGHRLVIGGFRGQGATTIDIFEYSEFGSPVPLREFEEFAAGRSDIRRFVAQTTTDGKYLVTQGDGRMLAVFDIAMRKKIAAIDLPTGVVALSLSQDGNRIAVTTVTDRQSGGHPRVAVRVFETATLKVSGEVVLGEAPISVHIDNAARRLLTVSIEGKLSVTDLATKTPVPAGAVAPDEFVTIALSGDGALLATPGKKADVLEIRDLARDTVTASLRQSQTVSLARFSPDGAYLATAGGIESFGIGGRGRISVFDLSTEKSVLEVPYEGGVPVLSFSSDGSMLLVRLATGVIRVFQLSNGVELTRFAIAGDVASVAMTDGNRRILIVSSPKEDGLPQVYSRYLQPSDLIANVCSRLTRNLTWDEWAQYFGDTRYRRSCRNLPCPSGAKAIGTDSCVRE